MVFGYNTNVAVGSETVHVQTEDHGVAQALIDTTVHWKGRVLHRRTNNYLDLVPLDAAREAVLKERLDGQHRAVIEEIRSGVLKLMIPKPGAPPAAAAETKPPAQGAAAALRVELTNTRTWLSGRNATLQLLVRDAAGSPVSGAAATARVEGASAPAQFGAQTSAAGLATVQFEMPKISAGEAALVIDVAHNGAKGHLRFQLRAKPKV